MTRRRAGAALLRERVVRALFGGTSALSGGGINPPLTRLAKAEGVNDTKEAVLSYYDSASGGRVDLDVAESYIDNGDKYMQWAEENLNITWGFTEKRYQDYYEPNKGWLEFGRGNISVKTIDGAVNTEIAMGFWKKMRAVLDADSGYTANYRLPGQKEVGGELPVIFVQANTLEELAQKLNIDAAGLLAEVAAFNENAKKGVDPQFNRGGHKFDVNTGGAYEAGKRQGLANQMLAPLETAPYYGCIIVPGTFGTSGGLKVDPNSQVLNLDEEPSPACMR